MCVLYVCVVVCASVRGCTVNGVPLCECICMCAYVCMYMCACCM